jgi:hydrogenase expression/formation protein HypC
MVILCHVDADQDNRINVFMWLNHAQYRVGCITENFAMCVAVPAEVIEIKEGNIGLVDYGELRQEVRLDLVDVKVGEFVLVHVGFAIQRLSREEGLETREIFRQVYEVLDN